MVGMHHFYLFKLFDFLDSATGETCSTVFGSNRCLHSDTLASIPARKQIIKEQKQSDRKSNR